MPSSTSRHALRKNQAQHYDEGSGSDREDVNFNENVKANVNGDHTTNEDRRRSFASTAYASFDEEKEPAPPRQNNSDLIDALSNSNSELSRFLLANDENKDDEVGFFDGLTKHAVFDNGFMKSVRNVTNRIITGEDEVPAAGSLRTNRSWFYSLALEPMEVRRDRIIMLAEAYAIYGALFLSGTWVLYEWGSGYGYGGCSRFEESSFCHAYIDRAFEAVMTLCITANIFQAMFASFLWLMSILFSGSHRNWVFGSRHLLTLLHFLITCVFVFMVLGVGLGIYAKLAPFWPELAISLVFTLSVVVYGMWAVSNLVAEEASLEFYHFPLWFQWGIFPLPMLKRGGRKRIRERAEKRAKEMRGRALKERTILDPTAKSCRSFKSSVGGILRRAADSIGRHDDDVSKYEKRLEDDWYVNSSEMKNMSVDILSKYMPRRLAEEVHDQLKPKAARSIGSGVLVGEGRRSGVSWNLEDDDS